MSKLNYVQPLLRCELVTFILLTFILRSACYLSQSLPPTLDMISKYTQSGADIWTALINNANIGGENVHRGAVLGAILGARVGDENLPKQLKEGLYDSDRQALETEITSFVKAVMQQTESNNDGKEL